MTTAIARIAKGLLPRRHWTYLQSIRSRNRQIRWLRENRILEFAKRFSDAHGYAVLHGPFAGMRYPSAAVLNRHSVPRLLGSYESELHPVIQSALAHNYACVVDIGSAEGYYAVGFALKGQAPVVAFETDPRERELCREMAGINHVEDRFSAQGLCNPETLRALAAGKRCFVLSDCEGYEVELFDVPTVAALGQSDVLIEIHLDTYEPLVERFSKTHKIQTFIASPRLGSEYSELSCLGRDADLGICEFRPEGQRWILAKSMQMADKLG